MEFAWIMAVLGGAMIGLAGAVYLLVSGRIMGVSGILGGLVDGTGRQTGWERAAFLAGLIVAPGVAALFMTDISTKATGNLLVLVIAGLLVGFGTRLANGCTSGHGVCGMSRLSFRSIAATLVYIAAGVVSLFVFRHIMGLV